MKVKYKTLLIFLGIMAFFAFAFWGIMVGSGNYGYAQRYVFDVSSGNLIKAIEDLKMDSLNFSLSDNIDELDSIDTANSHFHVEVYLKKQDISFVFFIELDDRKLNSSELYLVSVNNGTGIGDWKTINRDLKRDENRKVKRIFEEEILNNLKLNYHNFGNNMFIFWK